MKWPTPQEFNEAIQNPQSSFTDADLMSARPELSRLGLPRVQSGSFASVYRLRSKNGDWAVRCFLRPISDQAARYRKISQFVMSDTLPYTVGFEYLANGLHIGGNTFPILKMDWVDGITLDFCIQQYITRPHVAGALLKSFTEMMNALQQSGLAHGDLQHGNIILSKGELRLVDYDGMFVPGMESFRASELGHRNYQHPRRAPEHFDGRLDNFSAWVIYASLSVVSIDRGLWQRAGAGDECLLFRQSDFVEPERSPVLRHLASHPSRKLRLISEITRMLLALEPLAVPTLGELTQVIQGDELFARLQRISGRTSSFDTSRPPGGLRPPAYQLNAKDQVAIEEGDQNDDTSLLFADRYFESHQWESAAIRYEAVCAKISTEPADVVIDRDSILQLLILERLGVCYLNLHAVSKACAVLTKALNSARKLFQESYPEQLPQYQLLLALALWRHSETFGEAKSNFHQAILVQRFPFDQVSNGIYQSVGLDDFHRVTQASAESLLLGQSFADMAVSVAGELFIEKQYQLALMVAKRGLSIYREIQDELKPNVIPACELLEARCEQQLNYPSVRVVWKFCSAIRGFAKAFGKDSEEARLALRGLSRYYFSLGQSHEQAGRTNAAAQAFWKCIETYIKANPSIAEDDPIRRHISAFAAKHNLVDTWRRKLARKSRRKSLYENKT